MADGPTCPNSIGPCRKPVSYTHLRAHGPSLVDGLGMVILIAAWVPLVALLWSSLSALRCGFGFGAATLAVGGAVLLAVTIGGDTGAEWLIAVGMLIAAQLMAVGLAWRGVRT